MHHLITRSIECFLRDTYGEEFWVAALADAGLAEKGGDTLLRADVAQTEALLCMAGRALNKPVEVLLEDLGTYLVSHRNSHRVRRLLRFSGETFEDFLHSLDDLPDRARLAVSDLILPALDLVEEGAGRYVLEVGPGLPGFGVVVLGALRAMADDYGALVVMEVSTSGDVGDGAACVQVSLLDGEFAEGKDFALSAMLGIGAENSGPDDSFPDDSGPENNGSENSGPENRANAS